QGLAHERLLCHGRLCRFRLARLWRGDHGRARDHAAQPSGPCARSPSRGPARGGRGQILMSRGRMGAIAALIGLAVLLVLFGSLLMRPPRPAALASAVNGKALAAVGAAAVGGRVKAVAADGLGLGDLPPGGVTNRNVFAPWGSESRLETEQLEALGRRT